MKTPESKSVTVALTRLTGGTFPEKEQRSAEARSQLVEWLSTMDSQAKVLPDADVPQLVPLFKVTCRADIADILLSESERPDFVQSANPYSPKEFKPAS